jgi:hypothetical protein
MYAHEVADAYEVCAYTVYTLGAYLIGVHLMGVHFTGVHLMWNPPQESHNREWWCGCAVVEVGGPEPARSSSCQLYAMGPFWVPVWLLEVGFDGGSAHYT